MILSFKHKGLKRFYETGSKAGIQADHSQKLRMILSALDSAVKINDMDLPGLKLHRLSGDKAGLWSVIVNGNWRVTFSFADGNAQVLNYEDYH